MDHLGISLVFWLHLSFIVKVHTDLVRCLVGLFPPLCCSFIWIPLKQAKTHEIPSEHKKTLLCVRAVEHRHWWSRETVSIPWSQSKPSWTQSWAMCAEGWARRCEDVILNFYNFVIDSVVSSASQGSHRVPRDEGRDPFHMCLWHFQIYNRQSNILHKTKEWNIDKAFLNKVFSLDCEADFSFQSMCLS